MFSYTKNIIAIILKDKFYILSFLLFFLIYTIYLFNPYINNSGDFIVLSEYALIAGCVFTFIWGVWGFKRFFSKALKGEIINNDKKIKGVLILSLNIIYFIIQIIIILLLIIYYNFFIFNFSINMSIHIFLLYSNYLLVPLIISLLFSNYLSILYFKESINKKITFSILLILFLIAIIYIQLHNQHFSLFYLVEKHFYNPFTGITEFSLAMISKTLMLLSVCLSVVLIIKRKNKLFIHISFMITVILIALIFCFYIAPKQNLKEYYIKNFINNMILVESVNNKKFSLHSDDPQYNIDEYSVEIIDDSPMTFNVDVFIKDVKSSQINFFLNNAFEIKSISSGNDHLSFIQDGNSVTVHLNSIKDQTLTFKYEGWGTALNPVNSDYIFLPYFFKWLPTNNMSFDYVFNGNSLDYHPFGEKCKNINNLKSNIKDLIIQESNLGQCLSIFKGDFISKDVSNITFHIPKVWSGSIEGLEKYLKMKEELLDFFNKEFNQNKVIPTSIIILPRFEDSPDMSLNDIWMNGNNEIILINPFLNINETPLFEHLYDTTILSAPFALMRDNIDENNFSETKVFSGLFAIHFTKTMGYTINDELLSRIYNILPKKYTNFSELNEELREDILHSVYDSILKK